MKLANLLTGINYNIIQGDIDIEIENISWDSRRIGENSLFVCVKNRNVDRHEYAAESVKKGASAIVLEHMMEGIPEEITIIKVENSRKAMSIIANSYYGSPSEQLTLIGITGTNGKTSAAYFISKILETSGRRAGIISTVQNTVGGKLLKTEKLNPTTPDAMELQASFREILDNGASYAVMEVTSSALSQDRVCMCDFDIGVFTNLTQDHLDEHGNMENYKKAKMKLFEMCKTGVINVDDNVSREIIKNSSCSILTYGIEREADIRAFDIVYSLTGVSFKINFNGIIKNIYLNIPGRFSVYNALAAIGVCLELGLSIDEIIDGIKAIEGVPGRFQAVPNNKGILAIVDYAHTPDSLEKILDSVKDITNGRIITVFGCGGNRDKTKRLIMGKVAGRLSDFCVITSDNPRKENPMDIIDEIEKGMKETTCEYVKDEDRKSAIHLALENAKKGDAVIIAGKGHETYQIIEDKVLHFNDSEVVEEFFAK
jgi:UDP-N-acetylmuramoyl-L-alanyl-D-glutamate--2,6-diaminopimelate ligase